MATRVLRLGMSVELVTLRSISGGKVWCLPMNSQFCIEYLAKGMSLFSKLGSHKGMSILEFEVQKKFPGLGGD